MGQGAREDQGVAWCSESQTFWTDDFFGKQLQVALVVGQVLLPIKGIAKVHMSWNNVVDIETFYHIKKISPRRKNRVVLQLLAPRVCASSVHCITADDRFLAR